MKPARLAVLTVFFTLTVSLMTLGLVVGMAMSRKGLENQVGACTAAVAARNPAADARNEFARGERRFYFRNHNGVVLRTLAAGVATGEHQTCEAKVDARPGASRDLPFSEFGKSYFQLVPGGYCCDRDPPTTACGQAIDQYLEAYNAEMARISPASIKDYCS